MDHNIIHHTETVPVREPLTEEQADKLIEQYGDTIDPLNGAEKAFVQGILTNQGIDFRGHAGEILDAGLIRQALDRIEEARAHGLA